ncbi:MAG: hypothetical protein IT561_26090 [Alphaproteobacteria bacterium]|nr:hypothetical protein [Alphaproteobacteria bacterium]
MTRIPGFVKPLVLVTLVAGLLGGCHHYDGYYGGRGYGYHDGNRGGYGHGYYQGRSYHGGYWR